MWLRNIVLLSIFLIFSLVGFTIYGDEIKATFGKDKPTQTEVLSDIEQ